MHIVGPYLTTNKSKVRGKKAANTAAARAAAAKHDEWLRKQGLHPEQRALASAFKGKRRIDVPSLKVDNPIPLSNNLHATGGFKQGVMANLHKESAAVQQEIMDKASRCMPLFNKGGYQYATPDTDMTQVGSKSRRG
jgi:hypothetical protein